MKNLDAGKKFFCLVMLLLVMNSFVYGDTHQQVQSVDEDGDGNHPDLLTSNKVTVEGIVLNRPDYMLDATPNEDYPGPGPGAAWQLYIQGEGDDHAGTAVWMGQCYDNLPFGNGTYTDPNWTYELYQLSHDPCTAYEIRPGDRVRVTGLLKFYGGKTNINERHDTGTDNNVAIELLEPAAGLPQPEVVAMSELKHANDDFIFDYTRQAGCEYYQARLIRINDVNIADCNDWGSNNTLTIQGSGRTFPVKLGIGPGFTEFVCPSGQIGVIGILDQEGGLKDNYRIWVVNYDGNGKVLTDFGFPKNRLPGDINLDGKVDFSDFAEFANDWLDEHPEGT